LGNIKDNRLNSLSRNSSRNTLNNNEQQGLKTYKQKLYETRKPINIQKHFRNIITEDDDLNEQDQLGNEINIIQTNFITCPECDALIDIKQYLETKTNIHAVKCTTCGIRDIDLVRELKKHNKLDLAKSAGIPTSKLLTDSENFDARNMIVRPTSLKLGYKKDTQTGVKQRIVQNSTVNNKADKNLHINSDFMDRYNNLMSDQQKIAYQPLKSLIDKGIQIKRVIDIK